MHRLDLHGGSLLLLALLDLLARRLAPVHRLDLHGGSLLLLALLVLLVRSRFECLRAPLLRCRARHRRFRRFHRLRASLPSQLVRRRHLHPCDPRCRRREIFRRGPSVIFRPGSRRHRDAPPRLAHFTQGGPERTLDGFRRVRAHVSAQTCDGRVLAVDDSHGEWFASSRAGYGEHRGGGASVAEERAGRLEGAV